MAGRPLELGPQAGPQSAFVDCPADIGFYGGSAGGGKTYGLLYVPLRYVRNYPGFRGVIFRRLMPQISNQGGLWDESMKLFPLIGGQPRSHVKTWQFPSGASIQFSHLQYEETKRNWDGSQIAYLAFDEVHHFSSGQFWYLLSRNRSMCGVKPFVRATCNPDASSWVRELIDWWIGPDGYPIAERSGVVRWFVREGDKLRWVDESHRDEDGLKPKSLTFIAAKVTDNPALLEENPEYMISLKALQPVDRARLLDGNWNVRPELKGRIYSDFRWAKHALKPGRAKELENEARGLRLYEAWDFGSGANAATVILWGLYNEALDTLFLWDCVIGFEKPFEWYAQQAAAKGYAVQCMRSWDLDFSDCPAGWRPYARVGDPAGRSRDSRQRSWFRNLADYAGIDLNASVNKPHDAIVTVQRQIRAGKILLHPRLKDTMGKAIAEYRWNVPDDYDPETAVEMKKHTDPLKDWASHPCDALAYMAIEIWGFIGRMISAR